MQNVKNSLSLNCFHKLKQKEFTFLEVFSCLTTSLKCLKIKKQAENFFMDRREKEREK